MVSVSITFVLILEIFECLKLSTMARHAIAKTCWGEACALEFVWDVSPENDGLKAVFVMLSWYFQ